MTSPDTTHTLKEVINPEGFPSGRCYVIQVFKDHAIYHEGDERSRTNPGHGYLAHTEHIREVRLWVTQDVNEWKSTLERMFQRDKNRTDIAAFTMEKAEITSRVEVEIGDP